MKKVFILLLTFAMLLSFPACGTPAAETAFATASVVQTPVVTPSLTPELTPEPTMSPKEIEEAKIAEEYEGYMNYFNNYHDDNALFFIKHMLDEGKITEETLGEFYEHYISATDPLTWSALERIFLFNSNIINGKAENMANGDLNALISEMDYEALDGIVEITLLDTEEKREKVIKGMEIIDRFYENPTEENKVAMEDMFFSEGLSPGEITMLFAWTFNNPKSTNWVIDGKKRDIKDYTLSVIKRYGKSIGKIVAEAYDTLVKQNNTPYAQKD